MYRKRKGNNILRGMRGSYPRGNGTRRIYGDDSRSNSGYGYMSDGGRPVRSDADADSAYSGAYAEPYRENGARGGQRDRVCRVNASETRAGRPVRRDDRMRGHSGRGGYREGSGYNGYDEYRYGRPEHRSSGSSGAATRGKRKIFSMAAWTASFIMVLNMLPADSPVSQVIAKYEESLPAMSLGLEELKNGPKEGQGAEQDTDQAGSENDMDASSGGGASDGQTGGTVNASAEASGSAAASETTAAAENGASAIENIALVTSSTSAANVMTGRDAEALPAEDAAGSSGADKAAGSSKTGVVKAAADASGIVTFNGIRLVLSDAENANAAAGAAASANNTGSAAQQTTASSTGGAASQQTQNGSSPSQTPPPTPNQQTVLTQTAADSSKTAKVSSATGSGDIIIYHTHATEAYAPVANAKTTHSADAAGTVREAGNNLAAALKAKGYNVIHDTTLHDSPSYNKSYNRSLETLKKLLKEHKSPKLVIDFHRDAATASGKAKTATVNGETVASFALVVGTKNDNYKNIRALADKIVKKSNELYPGLCTGIIEKPYKFNGYLSNSYILLELGNNANTITQINAAAPYLADVLTNTVQ